MVAMTKKTEKREIVKTEDVEVRVFEFTDTERVLLAEAFTRYYRFSELNKTFHADDFDAWTLHSKLTNGLSYSMQERTAREARPAKQVSVS